MAGYLNSNDLKVGTVFNDGGESFSVIKYQHIKKGRGQATIRVKVRNLSTGSITEKTYSNEQKVEEADVEKRNSQFLYQDGTDVYFMDANDYSQYSLPVEALEWELNFITEGTKVVTMFLNESPVSVEIPKSMELKITDTADNAVAGNTSTNATKPATLETGYETQVPLFIKQDEVIKVNTDTGEYVSRAGK